MDEKEINIITGCKEYPRVCLYMDMHRKLSNDCHVDFFITVKKKRRFLHRFYLVDALGLGRYDHNKLIKFVNWTKDSMVNWTETILSKEDIKLDDNGWNNIKETYFQIILKICEENK
jgi:hypothetical protein